LARDTTQQRLTAFFFALFCSCDRDRVAVLRFDDPTAKVNTLSKALQGEFKAALERVENDDKVDAAVLISGKPGCFIAGADIKMLSACKSAEELAELSRNGQRLFAELLASGKPKVAAIDGSCLGGGLEVALACHYRIASSSSKTVLALPEVMLGLLPGAGGTQRLPRLVGIQKALPLLLTGKNVRVDAARRMRLIDGVADPAALEHAALLAARSLADGSLKPRRSFSGVNALVEKALTGTSFGRDFVFKKARQSVMKQTKGKYPAPLAIVDVVQKGFADGVAAGYDAEATRFGELGMVRACSRALPLTSH
jgi:enoyl-CoA hydratase/long-chain 3-hydroxyacyl-CoA dehydrogenase